MGFGGIGIWQLLIILAIVVLLFGTKKLRSIGSDLGGALKGFKNAIKEGDDKAEEDSKQANIESKTDDSATATKASTEKTPSEKN